jgi:hypothetical protein
MTLGQFAWLNRLPASSPNAPDEVEVFVAAEDGGIRAAPVAQRGHAGY